MAKVQSRPVRVLHAIALEGVGGVETLYHGYLTHARKEELELHTLILHGRCHPNFLPAVAECSASVHYARYWNGVKIPPWPPAFRKRHLEGVLAKVHPDVMVLQNSLGNRPLWEGVMEHDSAKVYYDQGAAWIVPHSDALKEFLAGTDKVICGCRATGRMLELRWSLPLGRTEIVGSTTRPALAVHEVHPKKLDRSRKLILGTASRLIPIKGIPVALHALRELRKAGIDCELRIAGKGPDEEKLRQLAARLEIAGAVTFLGLVTEMAEFYSGIDIFLCPSLREPFATVCVEAGHFGCPVICTAVDGFPEIVLDGVTGFCVPPSLPQGAYDEMGGDSAGLPEWVYDPATDNLAHPRPADPARIAARICHLRERSGAYEQMSNAAHERATSHFALDKYVGALNKVTLDAASRT